MAVTDPISSSISGLVNEMSINNIILSPVILREEVINSNSGPLTDMGVEIEN